MEYIVEQFQVKPGVVVKILQDSDAFNPRTEWDNLTVFHCFHRHYALGDNPRETVDEFRKYKSTKPKSFFFPLYAYDHGGISISLTRDYPFNCPWDSGVLGEVEVKRSVLRENFKKIGRTLAELEKKAYEVALCEVEDMNKYLCGEVYCFLVEHDGDVIYGCGGFYDLGECRNEAKAHAETIGIER